MPIATKSSKIDITSEKDTKSISEKFSKYWSKGDIVCFKGEVGVGKTTFIKHLINYLQSKNKLKKSEVPSPTFNLLHEYEINEIIINHYDLYRIKKKKELINLGLFENCKFSITFIEWPELIENKLEKRIDLNFKYEENLNKRSLTISTNYKKKLLNVFK